jgi:NitT/TauT family transport system substrate-binding protein
MKKALIILSVFVLTIGALSFAKDVTSVNYYPAWFDHWENAGPLVAITEGIYEDFGLQVSDFPGGPKLDPITRMLDDRKISFCTSYSWIALVAYIEQGFDNLRVISTDFQDSALYLVTWFPVRSKEDLFGKKIECWINYQYPLFAYLGEDYEKINFFPQEGTMERFLSKQVDGSHAMIYNELLTLLDEFDIPSLDSYYAMEDKPFYIYKYSELDPTIAWGENSLITTRETISEHPSVVQDFVTATYAGWKWVMKEDPDKVVDIILIYNDLLDRSREIVGGKKINQLMVNDNTREYGLGYIDISTWTDMGERLYEAGLISRMPTAEDILNFYHPVASGVFPPE